MQCGTSHATYDPEPGNVQALYIPKDRSPMNIAHLEALRDRDAHHQMSALHFDHLEARAERLNDPKAAARFAAIARHHRRAAENLVRDIATEKDRAFNPLTVTNYLTGAGQ